MSETYLLTYCSILSLITSLYALLLFHRTSLLPKILNALATTAYTGHYHYVKMLVDNANSIGANIPIENQSAKQHLVPALKAWKGENLSTTIVDTSLAYDNWKGTKYVLAFGDNLAARVIAHNGRSGQPVEPGTASGTNSANNAATHIDHLARATATNAPAGSTTTVGAGSAAHVASVLASLGPEFLAQFMTSAKQQSTDGTARAEDKPNPLDAGVLDSASFQDQINAMNEIGAGPTSVAPFDKVEVTGVRQNPYPQSFMYAMVAACPGLDGVHPTGNYGAIMQYCAAQLDNSMLLRSTPPQFGDQLSPGNVPLPEMNGNGLLGLRQHTSAYDEEVQSPQGRLQGGLLHPPTASLAKHSSFSNQSQSPGRGLLSSPSGTSSLH